MFKVSKARQPRFNAGHWCKAFIIVSALLTAIILAGPAGWSQQMSEGLDQGSFGEGGLSGSKTQQLLQQLNIPPDQLEQMREEVATGGASQAESQKLCASMAAKHFSPDEVQSIARALGMPDEDITKLENCTRFAPGAQVRTEDFNKAPPPPSEIEKQFHSADSPYRELVAPEVTELTQFGYDMFKPADLDRNLGESGRGSPFDNVPVGPDYVVGPGDELNVLLWGRINRSLMLSVERDGTVLIPQVGPVPVGGLSFAEAQKVITGQMGQIDGVQADVTMGRLRTIEVYVIGQVAHPGLQTLSALAHVSDALNAGGGVRKTGSLRRVEVRREGQPRATIDLYGMLLRGDTSGDLRLQPRDVVFVPVIGPVVGVAGDVKNPAIYELRDGETLSDAVRIAGGVSAFGYAQRVQVERVQNHAQRVILDLSFSSPRSAAFPVVDGDLVKVFPVLPEQQNIVKLEGNVNRPGIYEWRDGMRVSDLILQGQGLHDGTFLDYALLRRREGITHTIHFLQVALGDAIADNSDADLRLSPEDTLTVYSIGEINEIPTVSVSGAVRKPGTYPMTKGMRVSDLVYEAGGLTDSAYLNSAQLARTVSDGSTAQQIRDTFDLRGAMAGNPGDDIALERRDTVVIAEASNWHAPWVVEVKGQAMRPGPYVIQEGEKLSSVLERCGGLRPDGYFPALILTRQSVRTMQQRELDRASAEVQTQITRAALLPSESDKQQQASLQQKADALLMLKNMIQSSDQKMATGRVVLNLTTPGDLTGSASDIVLEERDQIIVPRRPATVNVVGQVRGATAVIYNPLLTVQDYIDLAGGFSSIADKEETFVVKVNGSILSESGLEDSRKNRTFPLLPLVSKGGIMTVRLAPGDTIYVPPEFLFVNPVQRTLDITQIIANSAEAIGYAALLGTSI